MTKNQIVEFVAILKKLNIENQTSLTREEKEIYKQIVDELAKLAKQ